MDISILEDIKFVETDPAQVEQEIINAFENISGKTLYAGDPVRLFLEGLAYVISQQRFLIDKAAKSNLLAYASGNNLDHIGALLDVVRLEPSYATVDVQFNKNQDYSGQVTIPLGTRVTPDNKIYFKTIKEKIIETGETNVTVKCICTTAGQAGNGFTAGQITTIVDPVGYIESVTNTSTSFGGADSETDEHFRSRIQIAPEKFSTAGPAGAYEYWAKTAHPDIADVYVSSPSPGVVDVYPLMKNGGLPDAAVIQDVEDILTTEKKRPLTDSVSVYQPQQVNYTIDIVYYINNSDASVSSKIQQRVQEGVKNFTDWTKEKLGRDINPSELIRVIQNAGAKRVVVNSPSYTEVAGSSVAIAATSTITYGGLEDE